MQMRYQMLAWMVVLAASACNRNAGSDKPADKPPATESSQEAPKPAPALPPGHVPISGSAAPKSLEGPAEAGGLTWEAPAPLVRKPPESAMRAAQYGIEGEPSAELAVFYFGPGQGGAVEPNITRWLGQFSQPDGSDTGKKAKRSQRTPSGLPVTVIEVTGTYSGGMAMPGAPQAEPSPNWMLLGAIASGPEGPVFFKLVGPRPALEQARGAFIGLVDSIHPAASGSATDKP